MIFNYKNIIFVVFSIFAVKRAHAPNAAAPCTNGAMVYEEPFLHGWRRGSRLGGRWVARW